MKGENDSQQDGERAGSGIQVITRAAVILRALEDEEHGLSLSDIAVKVGLARSTVQRIVKSLIDEDFLMPASSQARVKLGPELVRLGAAANLDIAPLVKPYMQDLSRRLKETVDLSTLRRGAAVFVEQVAGSHRLAAISQVGTVFPLHSTANGKALLAAVSPDKRPEYLTSSLVKDTVNTVTDPALLSAQLDSVLETGLAFDNEEHTDGICAVATVFMDGLGKPYALSIPVPVQRFISNRNRFEQSLLEVRETIVQKIAGSLPAKQELV